VIARRSTITITTAPRACLLQGTASHSALAPWSAVVWTPDRPPALVTWCGKVSCRLPSFRWRAGCCSKLPSSGLHDQ
jgi:hypothetical protein